MEAAIPITDKDIVEELKEILSIQLSDNVKARILDNELLNKYVDSDADKIRSQIEIHNYLHEKSVYASEPVGQLIQMQ